MWDLVVNGGDGISPFPTDRGWRLDTVYGGEGEDRSTVLEGGFLHDAPWFDPG
ncbi:beta-ketoacyl synthase N-terminal-like domain-containing protein, partial [Actinoalloteichus caeruleus]|uniref:beta-ketoacyl synthase N-terminal-like domain-containing protein n=1 Tax=Actinoalloteichus cyanogriseus TaxID=2893586 RepID=UPI003AA892F1